MYYQSKKDVLFALLFWGVVVLMGWLMIVDNSIVMYVISMFIISFLLWMWFGTSYRIDGDVLKVKSGPLRGTVNIEDIRKLTATRTLFSAPALSIDRIEILYKKYDIMIVSPMDKTKFVQALLTKNSYIEVDRKLLKGNKD